MDEKIKAYYDNLTSSDDKVRMNALQGMLKLTDQKVDWVYDIWNGLFEILNHENSFHRSIAIKVICNLAKSDSENRLSGSLGMLLAHTTDEKFITSRQCIQSIWKAALTSKQARKKILEHLEKQFRECRGEKHYNLIRADIIQSILYIYDEEKDEPFLARTRTLIAEEKVEKYRKQYEAIMHNEHV